MLKLLLFTMTASLCFSFQPPIILLKKTNREVERSGNALLSVNPHVRQRAVGLLSATLAPASSEDPHVETILFVECGFGADAHGQNSTKAAVRACRNAIEFNQIPCIGDLVPGGRDAMKLDVLVAVPFAYQQDLNIDSIKAAFPYGKVRVQIQSGGMVANSGKAIASLGDKNTDMIIVCVAVTVGY